MPEIKKTKWTKAEKDIEMTEKNIKLKRLMPGACEDCFKDKKRDQSKSHVCKTCGKEWVK